MTNPIQPDAPAAGASVAVGEEDALRGASWGLLANLLGRAPDEQVLEVLSRIDRVGESADSLLAGAWGMLRDAAGKSSPAELSDEYHELFIGIGRGELVPYGSWYLTGFLMEQPLARLRVDLQALGFERQEGVKEPEDHAAALCDVMAMISSGDDAVPLEQQSAFFERHISPWMGRFFRDMQEASAARFYRAVGSLGEQFIEVEKEYLRVPGSEAPAPASGKPSRPS
ncbi:MAG: molecular chaperone TorD family protein [Gammaproteobacteria bacterium]